MKVNIYRAYTKEWCGLKSYKLSKFPMLYQQFASRAYCEAAGPVSKMALQE
jgi:hypothetical protein